MGRARMARRISSWRGSEIFSNSSVPLGPRTERAWCTTCSARYSTRADGSTIRLERFANPSSEVRRMWPDSDSAPSITANRCIVGPCSSNKSINHVEVSDKGRHFPPCPAGRSVRESLTSAPSGYWGNKPPLCTPTPRSWQGASCMRRMVRSRPGTCAPVWEEAGPVRAPRSRRR